MGSDHLLAGLLIWPRLTARQSVQCSRFYLFYHLCQKKRDGLLARDDLDLQWFKKVLV